jgi:SNF2 family DNA or RNA helicase
MRVRLRIDGGRIYFVESPYALKNEIKVLRGSKWHDDKKMWSVSNCPRNRFQLEYLMGGNPYAWFDRPVEPASNLPGDLFPHQVDLINAALTYHYQIWAAEPGLGKTRAALEYMARSGIDKWWWVGPKPTLPVIREEIKKWGFENLNVDLVTYDQLVARFRAKVIDIPAGLVGDESQRCKNATALRTQAMQHFADLIRAEYGFSGSVLLMSGTPSPKSPLDWYSQTEIVCPGFLREGSIVALEQRLAFMVADSIPGGPIFRKRLGWRDNHLKCNVCGVLRDQHCDPTHAWEESRNEVAYLKERLQGLVTIKLKRDNLAWLPDKHFRVVRCRPSQSMLRAAKAIVEASPSAILAATKLRELSDGFQYEDEPGKKVPCTHCESGYVVDVAGARERYDGREFLDPSIAAEITRTRVTCPACGGTGLMAKLERAVKQVPCPKDQVIRDLLDEMLDQGRIVIYAAFTASIDRVVGICHAAGWDVVRCDGRGYSILRKDSSLVTDQSPLEYWANTEAYDRVAFVAYPGSGVGQTLVEATMAVFVSNTFRPEDRFQAMERIHRPGMDLAKGATIVDIIHLPSDERVLQVLKENRQLEKMTLGELFSEGFDWHAE